MQNPSTTEASQVSANDYFDNDQPDHRAALVAFLSAEGMDAYGHHSGGGIFHVCVNLLEDGPDWLSIATGDTDGPAVGLMGERDGVQVESGFDASPTPKRFGDFVFSFKEYRNERRNWLDMFRAGALDL